ncbi:MAG: RNA-binding protein [Candidatus Competibacteraceae bacterium]|nr:RNA-binding protein [Candidatus Competibacteraceae bacterium]
MTDADREKAARAAEAGAQGRVRLDKWLWAARFFKTRTLAAEAVSGGKVHVGGQRAKPSHAVRVGEILRIQRGPDEYLVEVKALGERRGPAKDAALLYEETAESRLRREQLAEQRRIQRLASPLPPARPTKQDRRRIVRFTRQGEPDR